MERPAFVFVHAGLSVDTPTSAASLRPHVGLKRWLVSTRSSQILFHGEEQKRRRVSLNLNDAKHERFRSPKLVIHRASRSRSVHLAEMMSGGHQRLRAHEWEREEGLRSKNETNQKKDYVHSPNPRHIRTNSVRLKMSSEIARKALKCTHGHTVQVSSHAF